MRGIWILFHVFLTFPIAMWVILNFSPIDPVSSIVVFAIVLTIIHEYEQRILPEDVTFFDKLKEKV